MVDTLDALLEHRAKTPEERGDQEDHDFLDSCLEQALLTAQDEAKRINGRRVAGGLSGGLSGSLDKAEDVVDALDALLEHRAKAPGERGSYHQKIEGELEQALLTAQDEAKRINGYRVANGMYRVALEVNFSHLHVVLTSHSSHPHPPCPRVKSQV